MTVPALVHRFLIPHIPRVGNMALFKEICGWGNKIFRFQCLEECKSNLGMGHYECRSY